MVVDKLKQCLDSGQMLSDVEQLAEPLAGLLNPETGEATKVAPDAAGWPKAKVTPGLPAPQDVPKPPAVPGTPAQLAAGEPPPLPKVVPAGAPKRIGAQEPAELANLETGEMTQILPDDAGWPKANVTPGMPGQAKKLAEMMPQEMPPLDTPKMPGGPKVPDQLPGGPDATLIKAPDVELPAGPKDVQIANLETGDMTTIVPDPANWPKASVKPGALPDVPKPPEASDPLKKIQDQLGDGPTIPK